MIRTVNGTIIYNNLRHQSVESIWWVSIGQKSKGINVFSIPTNAHRSSIKLILKLLWHVSVFSHHPQGSYKFCQLKLWIIELIKYNIAVCSYGKI
jgi:hypothetical protein